MAYNLYNIKFGLRNRLTTTGTHINYLFEYVALLAPNETFNRYYLE